MRKRLGLRFLILGLALLCAVDVVAQGGTEADKAEFDHSHGTLDALLHKYVHDGKVDYRGLQAGRTHLRKYMQQLARLPEDEFDNFTQPQKLALLINAYNAFTLELILQHYPVKSIQDIPGNWTNPQWTLYGKRLSMNDIENKEIRGHFAEARIHCALVCASQSCPPLRSEAYRADILEKQLASAASGFARDRAWNRLDKDTATLYVSKVFEWFADDFVEVWGDTALPEGSLDSPEHRGVLGYFMTYLETADADYLRRIPVQIGYNEYSWDLNGQHYD